MQAAAPICVLDGADFIYELVNPAYQQLLPGRALLGNSLLKDALSEVASLPFVDALRHVYRTGETIETREELILVARHEGGPLEERYFNYTASHDLKAPIFNIQGLIQVLIDSLPTQLLASYGLEEVIGMIEMPIKRFMRTIDHLTEVTKLQKENNQDAVLVNIAEVIQEVRLDLSPQLEAAGAQLEVAVDDCVGISLSEKNLRSVVYNLISNAVKYHAPERAPKVQVSCRQEAEHVVLTVRDNGLGMDLYGNQKLFTMFERLHDHVEGSGIGLYMVKKIVENAGGRIRVESQPGVGTIFTVYFRS